MLLKKNIVEKWGYSSAGRALAWHARGHRFDPVYLHQFLVETEISPGYDPIV